MALKEESWEVVKPHLKAMLTDVVDKLAIKAVDQVILESENKIDDTVWAVLKEKIVAELKNQISHI